VGGLAQGVDQRLEAPIAPADGGPMRVRGQVEGVVQGVGFRPFVYNLALKLGLSGMVTNTAAGVELAVQGQGREVGEFFRRLVTEAPPLAQIDSLNWDDDELVEGEHGFVILESRAGTRRTLISPDTAVCADCLAEMRDPADRRHGYAFINCTHCGPRYTIIQDLPYDRPFTTMNAFTMCPSCQAEYDDPADRRFHAQPNACPECGPHLWLTDADGAEIACADPVEEAAEALRNGEVVAIKGLGGFHLAVDALNEKAVARLRSRKHREEKPLALMAPSLEAARALVELDPASEAALVSRERPIVLCPKKPNSGVAPSVNPRNRLLGVMLPYTPLHHLLMDQGFKALVMTSGNVSEEPICLGNNEAVSRIGGAAPRGAIADKLLLHNRDIYLRSDDSVVRVVDSSLRYLRRSRGFVPVPLKLAEGLAPPGCPPVLATGAHLKNTLCLLRGREAFVSQHVGDLENLETLDFFELTAGHLERILEASPGVIACDLHPDYLSTRWAREAAEKRGVPLVRVQHHHAHAVALMAEHGLTGPVLALSLDGTGYGPDGTVWGGEMLQSSLYDYQRLGHVRRFALPGGEAAVKEPWRVAQGMLLDLYGDEAANLDLQLVRAHGEHLQLMARMKETGLNTPLTSSLGRLFDAAAALCGLRFSVAYEGQAAIEFEQAMETPSSEGYEFALAEEEGQIILDWRNALHGLVDDVIAGANPSQVSARFHSGLIAGLADWAQAGAQASGLSQVCLGGGCLLNAALLTNLPRLLKASGLEVYTPQALPAGDGGLSLGQALAGAAAWQRGLHVNQETVLGPTSGELKS
jgi:hydrogenase maturation protein HypF